MAIFLAKKKDSRAHTITREKLVEQPTLVQYFSRSTLKCSHWNLLQRAYFHNGIREYSISRPFVMKQEKNDLKLVNISFLKTCFHEKKKELIPILLLAKTKKTLFPCVQIIILKQKKINECIYAHCG